jgi:putative ABC transport system ATP-binding protein
VNGDTNAEYMDAERRMKMTTTLEKITKIYKTGNIELTALKGISLKVADGEFLSIAGPSGSGKTTLLNIIGCLDDPNAGTVKIDGRDVSSLKSRERAELRNEKIGFIFQTFNLIPVLTAFENVEFALMLRGNTSKTEQKKKTEEILELVGLKDFMKQRPTELSGGQQQRVAIARALVKKPSLVLADEPTANLDSETASGILMLMRELNKQENVSFIFSTHDRMVMDFADRLIILKDGVIHSDTKRKK